MIELKNKLINKANRAALILKYIPFVRMIALTGSLANGKVHLESDIDFFIIIKAGRIWQTRLFIVLILKLLGLHRTGDKIHQKAGKICLNRFVTDEYLLINPQNLYHANEYSSFIVLYNENNTYNKFVVKNNWINKYQPFKIKDIKSSPIPAIKKFKEWLLSGRVGGQLEKITRRLQLNSILKDNTVNKFNSGIYVDDNELRFHPKPR